MSECTMDTTAIVSRLERIEKENRRLKRVVRVVWMIAGVIVLVGAARPAPDIIRAIQPENLGRSWKPSGTRLPYKYTGQETAL